MSEESVWILLVTLLITGITFIVVAMILSNGEKTASQSAYSPTGWRVELWNIADGSKIVLCFGNMVVVGRMSLYNNTVSPLTPSVDGTISREQCMLYDNAGILLICNMSTINPTFLNDQPIQQPTYLACGSRIRMGYSTFLVTRTEHI